jgi:hypothetical protein
MIVKFPMPSAKVPANPKATREKVQTAKLRCRSLESCLVGRSYLIGMGAWHWEFAAGWFAGTSRRKFQRFRRLPAAAAPAAAATTPAALGLLVHAGVGLQVGEFAHRLGRGGLLGLHDQFSVLGKVRFGMRPAADTRS